MSERNRPMQMQGEADMCGVDAATYAAAMECVLKEQELAKTMAELLQKFYPGYPWEVRCEAERAAIMFRLPIMPPNVFFIAPFRNVLASPNDMERVAKFGGGELLERFDLSRGGIDFSQFEAARPRLVPIAPKELPKPLLTGLGGADYEAKPKLILPN